MAELLIIYEKDYCNPMNKLTYCQSQDQKSLYVQCCDAQRYFAYWKLLMKLDFIQVPACLPLSLFVVITMLSLCIPSHYFFAAR
jgi:hypothetical protein